MKKLTLTLCLTIAVLLGSIGASWGNDIQKDYDAAEKGLTAYNKVDYATALREFEPLAKQGNMVAQFYLGVTLINLK